MPTRSPARPLAILAICFAVALAFPVWPPANAPGVRAFLWLFGAGACSEIAFPIARRDSGAAGVDAAASAYAGRSGAMLQGTSRVRRARQEDARRAIRNRPGCP